MSASPNDGTLAAIDFTEGDEITRGALPLRNGGGWTSANAIDGRTMATEPIDPDDFFASTDAANDPEDCREDEPDPTANGAGHPKRLRVIDSQPFSRGDHAELGAELLRVLRGDGEPLVAIDAHLWRYDPATGLWTRVDAAEQSCAVQAFAGRVIDTKPPGTLKIDLRDVRGARQLAADLAHQEDDFFAGGRKGLVFTNGFVEVTATAISRGPHSPENRARFGYALSFERGVATPLFLRFLHSVFRDDDDREEKILLLQEFFGASLLGIATKYQRTVVFQGDGENGKNALIDVASSAFPPDALVAIAPQYFSSEYRRAQLAAKLLNVVSELPEAEIIESESFKAIVTGDAIDGRPIREAPFTFRPIAGHLFSANRLPGTSDQTHGFWRRFLVITFRRNFAGDPERDPDIASKIIAAERPGIIAWMLEGARRLLETGKYTLPPSHDEALKAWRRAADPVMSFLEECTETCAANAGATPAQLYRQFVGWCSDNGHRAPSSTKFGLRMSGLGKGSVAGHAGRRYPVRVPS